MTTFILKSFVFWRASLLVCGVLAFYLLPFSWSFPYVKGMLIATRLPEWLWNWGNFDGVHYLSIAQQGYQQFQQAFFPLYPGLISVLGGLLKGHYLVAGLIISNVAFLLSLFVLYRLLSVDFGEVMTRKILILMLSLPYAFFFGALYTESLFLLFLTLSFLMARSSRWFLAGVFGGLASLTRFVGVFLLPCLLIMYFQAQRSQNRSIRLLPILSLALVPLGLLVYMGYLQYVYHDPLYFLHAQAFFGAQRSGGEVVLLPQIIWRYFKIILSVSPQTLTFWNSVIELLVTFFVLGVIIKTWKKLPLPYILFAFLAWFAPTVTGSLSSMPRYVLPLFPVWVGLCLVVDQKKFWLPTVVVCSLLQMIMATLFLRGYFVA